MTPQGMTEGGMGRAETGQFDFMNYFLGLLSAAPGPELGDTARPLSLGEELKQPLPDTKDTGQENALLASFMVPTPTPWFETPQGNSVREGGAETRAIATALEQLLSKGAATGQWEKQAMAVGASALKADGLTNSGEGRGVNPALTLEGFPENQTDGETLSLDGLRSGQAAHRYLEVQSSSDRDGELDSGVQQSGVRHGLSKTVSSEKLGDRDEGVQPSLNPAPMGAESTSVHRVALGATPLDSAASTEGGVREVAMPQVVKSVETLVHRGGGEMTVALDPPDLGRLEIKVITRGKKVEVEMRPESVSTKSALEGSLNDLRQALMTQDLTLTRLDVELSRAPTHFTAAQGFTLQGDASGQAQKGFSQFHEGGRPTWGGGSEGRSNDVPLAAVSSASVRGSGRVDLRV